MEHIYIFVASKEKGIIQVQRADNGAVVREWDRESSTLSYGQAWDGLSTLCAMLNKIESEVLR